MRERICMYVCMCSHQIRIGSKGKKRGKKKKKKRKKTRVRRKRRQRMLHHKYYSIEFVNIAHSYCVFLL